MIIWLILHFNPFEESIAMEKDMMGPPHKGKEEGKELRKQNPNLYVGWSASLRSNAFALLSISSVLTSSLGPTALNKMLVGRYSWLL